MKKEVQVRRGWRKTMCLEYVGIHMGIRRSKTRDLREKIQGIGIVCLDIL